MAPPRPRAKTSPPITCVVADDHPTLRRALARILNAEGIEVVREVADGAGALAAIAELRPTVAILGFAMPQIESIDVVRHAAGESGATGIILYTGLPEQTLVVAALEAGARGLVLKEAPLDELLEAIKVVAGGEVYVDPTLGAMAVRSDSGVRPPSLSGREREILRLLADGKTNREIAEALFISPDTVRTYVRRAMEKLDADSRTQAVAIAIRRSLIA
jgi:DNA-binding NarL/FixJ family response regulator